VQFIFWFFACKINLYLYTQRRKSESFWHRYDNNIWQVICMITFFSIVCVYVRVRVCVIIQLSMRCLTIGIQLTLQEWRSKMCNGGGQNERNYFTTSIIFLSYFHMQHCHIAYKWNAFVFTGVLHWIFLLLKNVARNRQ
jgi:hypothetical protein